MDEACTVNADPTVVLLEDAYTQIQEDIYSVQFFGYSVKTFADSIYDAMISSVEESIDQVDGLLNDALPSSSLSAKKPPSNCDQLKVLVMQQFELFCDKLELYLGSNVFVVPKHLTLPEDSVQLVHSKAERLSVALALDNELAKLEDEIGSVATRIATLKQNGFQLKSTIAFCQSRLAVLDEIGEMIPMENLKDVCGKLNRTGHELECVATTK